MFCALNGATRTPAPGERPAQARDDEGLAGVGGRAGDEEARTGPEGRRGGRDHPAILPDCGRRTAERVLRCGHALRPFDEANPVQRALRRLVGVAARGVGLQAGAAPRSTCSGTASPPRRTLPSQWLAAVPVGLLTTTGAQVGASRAPCRSARPARRRVGRHRLALRLRAATGVVLQPARPPAGQLEVDGVVHPVRAEQVQGPDRERVREAALAIYPRVHGLRGAGRWARPRLLRAAPRARLSVLGVQRREGQLTRGRRRRAGRRACAGSR